MKLVDTNTVLGRVNTILLIIEESNDGPERKLREVEAGLRELKNGLDFHLESFPQTLAPGLTKPRKSKPKRRARRRA